MGSSAWDFCLTTSPGITKKTSDQCQHNRNNKQGVTHLLPPFENEIKSNEKQASDNRSKIRS